MSLEKCPECDRYHATFIDEQWYDAYTGEPFEGNTQEVCCSGCLSDRPDLELRDGRVVRKPDANTD